MKKICTLFMLGGVAIAANAQQINGSFNSDWHYCTPWDSKGNTTSVGSEPEGWHVSNVNVASPLSPVTIADAVDSKEGEGWAVKLTNKSTAGNAVPAYLTLGTPFATAQVNFPAKVVDSDGGTFGGNSFTYRPDALSFDYKRDNSHGAENATVVAYLWNGTWTQSDVPGNTAIWTSTTKVDMVNRDRNILGIDTSTGGNITSTEGATCVAKLQEAISESTGDEWQSKTIDFVYADKKANVENINVIFSASDYFGDRNNIVVNNTLTIDNVRLVYYHSLNSLQTTDTDGNPIAFNEEFAADKYNYTVDAAYDDFGTEVSYDVKGVGATVETYYDEDTQEYTITVKGNDYDAETNPDALTTYTIKYKKAAPQLQSLVVAGREFISAGNTSTDFTATGRYYDDDFSYKLLAEGATVETNYDEATSKLTVTLNDENAISNTVYTITFEGNQKEAVYQIPNSDFDKWNDTTLAEGWNSFNTATGLLAAFASMSPMPEKIEGAEGYGVRLTSKDLYIAYANGNMTTGHINMGSTNPADATNFNFTDRTDVDGNLPFAGMPDAFEVFARFTPGTAKEEGTALNGRVQLILHGEAAYHDPEVESLVETSKIASASVIIPATEEWTKFTGEFNYTGNTSATMYLLASATTNPLPGASKDDVLDLDNLRLIYYNTLTDLRFNGKTVDGFSPEKTEYTIEGVENVDEIANVECDKKSQFSTTTTTVDAENRKVTIVVYGNDSSVNPDNKTVYTINFPAPIVDGIGSISADEAQSHKVYTLNGVRVSGKPTAGVYVVDGKKVVIK